MVTKAQCSLCGKEDVPTYKGISHWREDKQGNFINIGDALFLCESCADVFSFFEEDDVIDGGN